MSNEIDVNKTFDTKDLKEFQKALETLSAKTDQQKNKMNQLADAAENAGKSFSEAADIAKNSLKSLDSVTPNVISSIGEIITQFSSAQEAVKSEVSAPLAWGAAIVNSVSVVISFITGAIEEYQKKQREAFQRASESAENCKSNIDDLILSSDEFTSLRSKLDNLNPTRSEEVEITQSLCELQNQLIDKYGLEASQINLVNGNLEEQQRIIEEIKKSEALEFMLTNGSEYERIKEKFNSKQEYDIGTFWSGQTPEFTMEQINYLLSKVDGLSGGLEYTNDEKGMQYNIKIKVDGKDAKNTFQDLEDIIYNELPLIVDKGTDEYDQLVAAVESSHNKYITDDYDKELAIFTKGNFFQSIIDGTSEASKTISETINDTISESQALIDGYVSSLSELASVYETVANGGSLSADNLKELIEKYPLLAEYINETGDVSLASGEKIKEAYEEERKALIDKLNAEKAEHSKKLGETSESMWSKVNSGEDYGEEQKAVKELNDRIIEINAQLAVYESELGELENSNITQKIDEQATALGNLSGAYKTITDGGSLSAESVKSLTAEFPQLQQYIAQTGDLTFSNGEIIKQAYQDEYDAMIKNLETEKQRLETLGNEPQKLQEINAELQIYKACLADIDEAPSFTDISGDLKSLANAYRELSDNKQIDVDTMISMIDKYPEVASAIANEGSLTKDQANIFKTLFEAKKNDYILTQQRTADNLKASLAETEGVIANIQSQIEAYKQLDLIMGAIAAAGLTIALNMNKEQAGNIKKEIEKVEARINAVQSIGADTYGKSDNSGGNKDTSNKALAEELKQLDHKKSLGKLTAKQEYDELVRINKKYKQNSDEKMDMEKRLYNAKKAWQDDVEKKRKNNLQNEYADIEHKKAMDQMSTAQELARLKKIRKEQNLNADERKELDEKIHALEKQQAEEIAQAQSEKLQEAYDDIEHKKAMDQMSTAQELAQLKKIRNTYKMSADERVELNEKIHALEKQQAEEIERANSEKLQTAYDGIENKKALGQMTAKEELAQLEKIQKTYKMNAEERIDLEIKIYNLKKDLKQDEVDSLNNLADAVTEALKNKYEEQRKLEEESINESIQTWQTWEDETVASIQGQIDALDELAEADDREAKRQEYENKRQQLEMQLAYEKDDYNRKSIEKELAKLDTDEAKRIAELEREDLKKSLNQEIENVRKESEQQQQQWQEILEANNKKYDDLTSDASLKAQTSDILMNSDQEEIVNLIKGYAPDSDLAGQTIGESLYNGFKSKVGDIESYIDGITNKITSFQNQLAQTANTAADTFWATRSSYQTQINAAQAPAPVSVNQTVNFNQPVTTPVQTKRQLDTVSQAIAQQIVNGY